MAIKRAIKAGNKSIISFKKAIKVGEITQLVAKDNFSATKTQQGITFTNNGNGSVTVTGTVTRGTAENMYSISNLKELIKGHKYLLSGCPEGGNSWTYMLRLNVYNPSNRGWEDIGNGCIFTFDMEYYDRNVGGIYIYEREEGTEVNRTYTPQFFDLTEMFGAGHEPATVAEFKAKFPEAYYPYQRAVLTVYNKVVRPCARKGEVVQLVNPIDFGFTTQTVNGITFTNNNDGSVTINGTATANVAYRLILTRDKIINGYVYLYGSEQNTNDYGVAWGTVLPQNSTFGIASINNNYTVTIKNGVTVNNVTIFPQIYNLTAMYGAGNEPKTFADFRKDFHESYYPYNPVQTKNLLKLKLDTVQHYVVPKIVRDTLDVNVKNRGGYVQLDAYLPAGTYTLSAIINNNNDHAEKNNYTILSKEKNAGGIIRTGYLQNTLTFTLDKDRSFYILIHPAYGVDSSIYRTAQYKLQIEKGSVATDYVPHDYI